MNLPNASRLWDSAETAEFLGIGLQTLRLWRMEGRGPSYIRFSGTRGRCAYDPEVVREWVSARQHSSTAEETVAAEMRA